MQKYAKNEKRYRLINCICLLAVYKKMIGTGRVLGTRILRYDYADTFVLCSFANSMMLCIFARVKEPLLAF